MGSGHSGIFVLGLSFAAVLEKKRANGCVRAQDRFSGFNGFYLAHNPITDASNCGYPDNPRRQGKQTASLRGP